MTFKAAILLLGAAAARRHDRPAVRRARRAHEGPGDRGGAQMPGLRRLRARPARPAPGPTARAAEARRVLRPPAPCPIGSLDVSGFGAALVTGGARRLGRAIALDLAARGTDVAIHYHAGRDAAEAVAAEARALGVRAAALGADLLDRDDDRAAGRPRPPRRSGGRSTCWSTTPRSSSTTPSRPRPGELGPPHRLEPARAVRADPGLRRPGPAGRARRARRAAGVGAASST